jgi:hypothetical protein
VHLQRARAGLTSQPGGVALTWKGYYCYCYTDTATGNRDTALGRRVKSGWPRIRQRILQPSGWEFVMLCQGRALASLMSGRRLQDVRLRATAWTLQRRRSAATHLRRLPVLYGVYKD